MNVREWALPVYTILMQLATGALFILWLARSFSLRDNLSSKIDKILRRPVMVIFFTVLVAIIGSHFHLSNPLQSFMAVANFKHSWLSREIVFTILMFFTCAALVDQLGKYEGRHTRVITWLGRMTVFFGAASIFCMSSIYRLPTQAPWDDWSTVLLFFGSSLLLGVTTAAALGVMDNIYGRGREAELADERMSILRSSFGWMSAVITATLILVVVVNFVQILAVGNGDQLAQTSMSLLLGLYQPLLIFRFVILLVGVGMFILATFWLVKQGKSIQELVTPVYLACLFVLVAEILGRFLFYATHVRMGI